MQNGWLIAVAVVAGVAGQTTIKLGVSTPAALQRTNDLLGFAALIVRSPLVLLGLVLYGVGALFWIAVLARLDLSYAYPFLALNFVLMAVVAWLALGEELSPQRWLGIGVICVGILLIASGKA
jgi:drug/metabolite transporter (DMT)-like permease